MSLAASELGRGRTVCMGSFTKMQCEEPVILRYLGSASATCPREKPGVILRGLVVRDPPSQT